ncbi:MAG: hypothetical protein HGJ94_16755 [Desulfosarcina sp.]|nr:hypothetical protein [Desulfosarcina sp.]
MGKIVIVSTEFNVIFTFSSNSTSGDVLAHPEKNNKIAAMDMNLIILEK